MSQTNCPCATKLLIQIKPQVAPSHSQTEPTCSPSQSLAQKPCVFPWPGIYTPPQGWETFVSFSMTHWDGPTTSRKPLWFGDRKPTGMVLPPAGNLCG